METYLLFLIMLLVVFIILVMLISAGRFLIKRWLDKEVDIS
jgi:hypothetical protein